MKKKLFLFVLSLVLLFGFVACQNDDTTTTEEPPQATTKDDKPEVIYEDLTPAPEVTPKIYHWVPEAIEAHITATVDLKEASEDSVLVLLGNKLLENFIDYELDDGELTIFGQTLQALNLKLGKHKVIVVTEHGYDAFELEVVEHAGLGTSIPKKTVKGLNMSNVESYVPTEVIENAPDLLITEIGVDAYEYSYIEVFNNTTEVYNLKNHRIVFSDLTKQTLIQDELFEQPLGMASAAFIYQDYEIPALETAIIWIVASYPWKQDTGELLDGSSGRIMLEEEDAAHHIFGDAPENLSIEKFRNLYGLDEDILVFPVRPQPALMNGTSIGDDNGFGATPIKGASNRLSSFNSKIPDRGVQIQKFDLDKKIPDTTEFAEGTAAYYKYDVGVLNTEEEVYTDGVFDRNKIVVYGGRETVNAFYARKVYYNENDEIVGYAAKANAIDTYNAPTEGKPYMIMYQEIVTPISTALIYGTYEEVDGELTLAQWGQFRSLEYTIPASADSTLMRYIPLLGTKTTYETQLALEASGTIKLLGLGDEVSVINNDSDIVVPESSAYPRDYLASGYNTIGRGIGANFGATD